MLNIHQDSLVKQVNYNIEKPLIVFANRTDPNSVGGLTSLMNDHLPSLKDRRIGFVGWSGKNVSDEKQRQYHYLEQNSISYHTVDLTTEEVENGYQGFHNQYLWPVFHGMYQKAAKVQGSIEANDKINNLYADIAIKYAGLTPTTDVFVNDYQLIKLGMVLANKGHTGKRAFHNHIPFGSREMMERAEKMGLDPYEEVKAEAITPLKYYHSIGFQSPKDIAHFATHVSDKKRKTEEFVKPYEYHNIADYRVTYNPVGINFERFQSLAEKNKNNQQVEKFLEQSAVEGKTTIYAPARIDYTKNHLGLIKGYRQLAMTDPEIATNIEIVIIGEDTRQHIDAYKKYQNALRAEIEATNLSNYEQGISTPDNPPIKLIDKMPREVLSGVMANAKAVTKSGGRQGIFFASFNDGMNLIGVEALAASKDNILISSDGNGCDILLNDPEGDVNNVPQPHVPTLVKVRSDATQATEEMAKCLKDITQRDPEINRLGNVAAIRNITGKYAGSKWLPHVMETFDDNKLETNKKINPLGMNSFKKDMN